MRTCWIITRDHVNNGASVDVSGPRGTSAADFVNARKEGEVFRLLDDDGIAYLRGKIWEGPEASGFEPLDDYGRAFGCTSIEYAGADGLWNTL